MLYFIWITKPDIRLVVVKLESALRFAIGQHFNSSPRASVMNTSTKTTWCQLNVTPVFQERWMCSPGETFCNDFRKTEFYHDPGRLLHLATHVGKDGYVPDFRLLQAALKRVSRERRHLKVLVWGNSFTAGQGCSSRRTDGANLAGEEWAGQLSLLSKLRGSPLEITVDNRAHSGSTTKSNFLANFFKYRRQYDIVVMDFSLTDSANSSIDATLAAIAAVAAAPGKPALLYIETFPGSLIGDILHGRRPDKDPCSFTDLLPRYYKHWGPLRQFRVPILSYPDVVCALPFRNKSSWILDRAIVKENRSTPYNFAFWNMTMQTPASKFKPHPQCSAHTLLAHVLFEYLMAFLREDAAACLASAPASDGISPTLSTHFDLKSFSSDALECARKPQTYLEGRPLSEKRNPFPADSQTPEGVWSFYEDAVGKPGWVARRGARGCIVFRVRLCIGVVKLGFLTTYTNIGSARCSIGSSNGRGRSEWTSNSAEITLNGFVNGSDSVTDVAELSVASRPCGWGYVRCCSEGEKFKLVFVQSC